MVVCCICVVWLFVLYGLFGYLVGFVEVLCGSGILVGLLEMVDVGWVMVIFGLGDCEVLWEGIVCVVLCWFDYCDIYDVMFDLWFFVVLGVWVVIIMEDELVGFGGLLFDDVEVMW